MTRWATSDTHFFHKNIFKHCPETRPWSSLEEMHEAMIDIWNSHVKPTDHIYLLGDVSFGKREETAAILHKLHGEKFLILGNHDKVVQQKGVRENFVWIQHYSQINVDGSTVVLFHYPIQEWNRCHKGSIHLYGHLHSKNKGNRSMDIGCDSNMCKPYNLEEVVAELKTQKIGKFEHNTRS